MMVMMVVVYKTYFKNLLLLFERQREREEKKEVGRWGRQKDRRDLPFTPQMVATALAGLG